MYIFFKKKSKITMKFNKAIICLIVCFLVLNAVEARKGKS